MLIFIMHMSQDLATAVTSTVTLAKGRTGLKESRTMHISAVITQSLPMAANIFLFSLSDLAMPSDAPQQGLTLHTKGLEYLINTR